MEERDNAEGEPAAPKAAGPRKRTGGARKPALGGAAALATQPAEPGAGGLAMNDSAERTHQPAETGAHAFGTSGKGIDDMETDQTGTAGIATQQTASAHPGEPADAVHGGGGRYALPARAGSPTGRRRGYAGTIATYLAFLAAFIALGHGLGPSNGAVRGFVGIALLAGIIGFLVRSSWAGIGTSGTDGIAR